MDLVSIQHPGGVTELALDGRLNMVTAARVREAIHEAIVANSASIAVDLSKTSFLDSSGLGALVWGLKAAREADGDLVLVNPTEQVVLVLDLTNMNATLRSFESVAEAYPHG
ncbi:STAS domain-containing protein [Microcella alkalica]|uniref:Anti-sigma factor antagonist n=1 Tax=Microcella alkalica TaxID=355930 RepID=A0A839E8S2_9MICO|nr:STAS domain-containing protein [Microcella alkalica]MBA8849049.1 anti-sigma B factor antagonist [Microcella alkalica]